MLPLLVIGVIIYAVTTVATDAVMSAEENTRCIRACWAVYSQAVCGVKCEQPGLGFELMTACKTYCYEASAACVKKCVDVWAETL